MTPAHLSRPAPSGHSPASGHSVGSGHASGGGHSPASGSGHIPKSARPLYQQAISLLGELVGMDTSQPRPTLPVIKLVVRKLRAAGANCRVASGPKGAVFATIGPARAPGGVVLSAHADVVDARGQKWKTPPFVLTRDGDRLYGRGTCDMKGFIACALAAAPIFAAAKLKRPLHFALSSDEEIGSVGMKDVLRLMRESGARPAAAIVGEPTRMRPVAGHKAGFEMRTAFRGVAAHSATPDEGVSAVAEAARFAVFLEDLTARMRDGADAAAPFAPPHGIVNVGLIRGGTARNIVAGDCEVEWHYRPLPDDDSEKVLAEVGEYLAQAERRMRSGGHDDAKIENAKESSYPGLKVDESSPALALAQKLLGCDEWTTAPYGADAGYFQQAGVPAALAGPGDIAQAHKPDEFIEVSEIEKCAAFMEALRDELETEWEGGEVESGDGGESE